MSLSICLSLFLFRVRDRVMRARQLARRNLQDRVYAITTNVELQIPFLSLEAINFLVEINQEEKICAERARTDNTMI